MKIGTSGTKKKTELSKHVKSWNINLRKKTFILYQRQDIYTWKVMHDERVIISSG